MSLGQAVHSESALGLLLRKVGKIFQSIKPLHLLSAYFFIRLLLVNEGGCVVMQGCYHSVTLSLKTASVTTVTVRKAAFLRRESCFSAKARVQIV